jgi:hypothetical protein
MTRRPAPAAVSDLPPVTADAEARRGIARLAADIRRIRPRLNRDALDDPRIKGALLELERHIMAQLDERRGRHRLAAGGSTMAAPAVVSRPVRDTGGFGHLKPDPLTATTGAELVTRLREYREWAGVTSFRTMAAQAGQKVSSSTMCTALNRDVLPTQKVVGAIIAGCGGGEDDQRAFITAWRLIKLGRLDACPPDEVSALRMVRRAAEASD